MATGSVISEVISGPAKQDCVRRTPSTAADEVAVFVSQYSEMSSSTSSGDFFRDRCCYASTSRSLDARASTPRIRRGVRDGVAYRLRPRAHHRSIGPVPHFRGGAELVECRAFLFGQPRWPGPPAAGFASASGGTIAGKLMWMPSKPAGAWRAIALGNRAPVTALGDVTGVPEALH